MMKPVNIKWWWIWLLLTAASSVYGIYALLGENKALYLPGETSHGHYQIEMDCDSCHGEAFTDADAMQASCVSCHGAELRNVDDSHPKSKFTDPRNADRVEILDARYCVTCHVEHRPARTADMGVTLPDDFCFYCHKDIADDRSSHEGMTFESCSTAGCHNYHDNQALYEDFLVKHAGEPALLESNAFPERNLGRWFEAVSGRRNEQLGLQDMDAPPGVRLDVEESGRWQASAHARGGINCSDCHNEKAVQNGWISSPGMKVCQRCHDQEAEGFQAGKHGMRLARGLPPMSPGLARLPMKKKQHDTVLGCSTCHDGHGPDLQQAAVDRCVGCHDDQHTRAYTQSLHFRLWKENNGGDSGAGRGVSCAGCHMPRQLIRHSGYQRVLVQHNQNAGLRPNEKMLRDVCMQCHGYEFSVNALADKALIRRNFTGRPAVLVKSVEMAVEREQKRKAGTGPDAG